MYPHELSLCTLCIMFNQIMIFPSVIFVEFACMDVIGRNNTQPWLHASVGVFSGAGPLCAFLLGMWNVKLA